MCGTILNKAPKTRDRNLITRNENFSNTGDDLEMRRQIMQGKVRGRSLDMQNLRIRQAKKRFKPHS